MHEKTFIVTKASPVLTQVNECICGEKREKICYNEDLKFRKKRIILPPGDFIVSSDDIIIATVLGSCISVCLYSEKSKFCGINHFMLPEPGISYANEKDIMKTDSVFYGINAMEVLINSLMKSGVHKEDLKAKVFGGANIIYENNINESVGNQNIAFVMKFLELEKIPVVSSSVGRNYARKILFFTKTHDVQLSKIKHGKETVIFHAENEMHFHKKNSNDKITILNK